MNDDTYGSACISCGGRHDHKPGCRHAVSAASKIDAVGRLFAAAMDKRDGLRDDTSAEVDAVVAAFARREPPHNALNLLVQASRVSPVLRSAMAEVEEFIAYVAGGDYADATDCPICPMVATDRDDALREVTSLREMLTGFVAHEDQPCRLDHHGYCQDHPSGFADGGCLTRRARDVLGLDQ